MQEGGKELSTTQNMDNDYKKQELREPLKGREMCTCVYTMGACDVYMNLFLEMQEAYDTHTVDSLCSTTVVA